MNATNSRNLPAAFDLPPGITIEAQGWGAWQPCSLSGALIVFDRNGESVPRSREVRVLCEANQDSQMMAVVVASKLRRMGWKNCKIEVRT